MNIIQPYIKIESNIDADEIYKRIENIGRVCYKSEKGITEDSAIDFIKRILRSGHESVIEHISISVRVICDRGVSHEIVRHRIASYSQESTRYCNYTKDKFNNQLTYINPCFWSKEDEKLQIWLNTMEFIEESYFKLISLGATPQEARAILPNSLKTELVMTMNLREWRHFLRMRTSEAAHPQMQEIANMILAQFKLYIPLLVDNI